MNREDLLNRLLELGYSRMTLNFLQTDTMQKLYDEELKEEGEYLANIDK